MAQDVLAKKRSKRRRRFDVRLNVPVARRLGGLERRPDLQTGPYTYVRREPVKSVQAGQPKSRSGFRLTRQNFDSVRQKI